MPKDYGNMASNVEDGCQRSSPVVEVDHVIVDANNLIYRMGHVCDHNVDNVIVAFIEKLDMLEYWYGGRAHVCWEGGDNWRHAILPTYKGNRKNDIESELRAIVRQAESQLRRILTGTRFSQWDGEKCEGDDIFAALAKRLENKGHRVGIYSSDRDLLQLATEKVSLIVPQRGASDVAMRPADVIAKQDGLGPEMIKEIKGLAGDAGDNIPGVPGIGEKTAIAMIKFHGSIFNVLDIAIDADEALVKKEDETKTAHAKRIKKVWGFSESKRKTIALNEQQAIASMLVGSIHDTVKITKTPHSQREADKLESTLRRIDATPFLMNRIERLKWKDYKNG